MHDEPCANHRRAQTASWIVKQLERALGRPEPKTRREPIDELVLTVLSQHTSDKNSMRAFMSLRSRFQTWEDVRKAPPAEIADAIRSGGLAIRKANIISRVLTEIAEKKSLHGIDEMPLQEAKARLTALPGIGPKTAACVLLFSCGRPALPVDTHVYRVSQRIGLIDSRVSANAAHDVLESMLRPEDVYSFHMNIIAHGRQVCVARSPRCDLCVLRVRCCHYQREQQTANASALDDTYAKRTSNGEQAGRS